jgi:SNF2 family DNA or RNA helicase
MKLIDNVNLRLGDDLRQTIKPNAKVSIAAASFSIYAFEALKKELSSIEELRFIFTSPTFIQDKLTKEQAQFYIPHLDRESELCGGEFELRLMNQLNQRAIARECSKWVSEKVTFKSNTHHNQPIQGLIHVHNADESDVAYSAISGFTNPDLGETPKPGFPTLIPKNEYPGSQAFLDYFDQIWSNENDLEEVTRRVQDYFQTAFRENSPEFIYFITLYNIFNEFLKDIADENLPNDEIGFKETTIWNKLYNFQKDAVIGAINKLEKFRGCILADSVGLGKTFSALAIIKYYEKRNKDVLVLCPKKLEDNWNTYRYNDRHNVLAGDRFRYDVLFHTDLSRDSGESNGRKLETVNWGNYGLVVIDESHNFRNNFTTEGRENRYQKLLRKVIREGIETKVLMLSATPVNNRFNDLRNQLALAYEGNPEQMDALLDTTRGIEHVFRRAQSSFNAWSKLDPDHRTTEKLLEMLDFDFFEILDSLTIARSRKHITTYYDTTDIGKFPQRNRPESIQSPLTEDHSVTYTDIADTLTRLNMSIYSPLSYVLPSRLEMYAGKYDKKVKGGRLTQIDRERSLQNLMRINLLKRIESSVDSFRLTIQHIIFQIEETLKALGQGPTAQIEGIEVNTENEAVDWDADWGDEENVIGKKVKVRVEDLDIVRWREDLESDLAHFTRLWDLVVDIRGQRDYKLQQLLGLISTKLTCPINDGNKKIILFTAFADTANYLYESIADTFLSRFGVHTALITGSRKATTAPNVRLDLNTLLSCFSPRSKDKELLYPEVKAEIDILIATDCISEGQNLQDCDYLVNYDIHWNPVRIVQRFGRIDRIGSVNDSITMVNFWPDISLDQYIKLKQKVENRMLISTMTGTGDDNILNEAQRDLEYRKIQLAKLQQEVIDLEDLREGVSITDLGLNEFRVDLSNYIRTYGKLNRIPEGLHAVVQSNKDLPQGVIYVLRNVNQTVNIDLQNRLHPYYLVYIKQDGGIAIQHTESKKVLDAFRLLCKGHSEPLASLCALVSRETDDYHDMNAYSNLLRQSINSIIQADELKEVRSLFQPGGTTALRDRIKGLEDFKLITFLIVR